MMFCDFWRRRLIQKALEFLAEEEEDAPWAALSSKTMLYMKKDFEECADAVSEWTPYCRGHVFHVLHRL